MIKGSSGSIFVILANYVLNNKGIVYGTAFNDKYETNIVKVTQKENLDKLMGSKYIQSNTQHTYSQVKEDLQNGKLVFYVGTPCQIAGLKSYLNKEYNNLLTADLVCHGVPSQKLFKKYIESIEDKYKSKIKQYYFRNKEKNGWGLNIKILLENGKIIYKNANLDSFYKSFLEGKTYREVCYNCRYTNLNREGDFTLADYWGIQREHPDFNSNLGTSAILINTKKGEEIFNNINSNIYYVETKIEKIIKENKNLIRPTNRPNIRGNIYYNLDKMSFKKYEKKELKFRARLIDKIKSLIPYKLKKTIKKVVLGGKK